MKKHSLTNFIKKISCIIIILLGMIALLPCFKTVSAATTSGVEEISFLQDSSNLTNKNTSNFTVSFNSTSSNTTNGLVFNAGNKITIYKNNGINKAISQIELISNNSNIISTIKANGYVFSTDSTNGYKVISEFINPLISSSSNAATFEATTNTTISKIRIYYEEYAQESDVVEYLILDLNYGNIYFKGTDSTNIDSNFQYTAVNENGTALNEDFAQNTPIYILQTTKDSLGNRIRYNGPIDNYYINIDYRIKLDIVLDNIWCTYTSKNGDIGGIHIPAADTSFRKIVTLRLKGINKFSRIVYFTGADSSRTYNESSLKITSYYGDGSTEGTLIAIGKQIQKENSVHGTLSQNGWNSVIGANDSSGRVSGLKIAGGTILAVATAKDQCSAIGAGGNGIAEIEITGGNITAIASSTGTAIGGGIGHLSNGGRANIIITGGVVNAYNLGQPYKLTVNAGSTFNKADFIPGTAIGGGSSCDQPGELGHIDISGNAIVNAYSNGGSGLGGGNSINRAGGAAEIVISNGNVKSYGYIPEDEQIKIKQIYDLLQTEFLDKIPNGGTIQENIKTPYNYGTIGSGIGGGSGQDGNGGSANITINGGFLDASSIGGGNSVNLNAAPATVTVNGGTVSCGTIGGGFSDTKGYAEGHVIVTGGSLNATMSAVPNNGYNDSMLYLTRIAVLDENDQKVIKGTITNLSVTGLDSSAYPDGYGYNNMVTDDDGMLYLWLPKNSGVLQGSIINENGEEFIISPWEEPDNIISAYEIGILKQIDNNKYNYYVNTVSSEYYTLYSDYNLDNGALSGEVENTTLVKNNEVFSAYIQVHGNYIIEPYYGVQSSTGKKTFQPGTLNNVEDKNGNIVENLYSVTITVTQNTVLVFAIKGQNNDPYYFILDLYDGDVNVTEGATGLIVEQNGYELTGFSGGLYLTSGGIACPNTINVNIDSTLKLHINNIILGSDNPCLSINSGTVELETGHSNDIIQSSNSSAIFIEEKAKLIINSNSDDALQIVTENPNVSAISGKGTLIFNNLGGYYDIETPNSSVPAISVGIFEFSGKNTFNAELYVDQFEFDLIGYIDSNDVLNDVNVSMENNTENFAARGVFNVLTNVKLVSDSVLYGNYVANYAIDSSDKDAKIGVIEIAAAYSQSQNGVGIVNIEKTSTEGLIETYTITYTDGTTSLYIINRSEDGKTCTLTIEGKVFVEGNIMIYAAAAGDIAYQIISYEGAYDASEHGISVAVNNSKFIVYYSDQQALNSTNYETIGSLMCPTYTNVTTNYPDGKIIVYIYIIIDPTVNTEGIDYNPVSSSGTVKITMGVNEWTKNLTCENVPCRDELQVITPNPQATAKWGTVNYIYYDINGNLLNPVKFVKGETYQVRAYVDAGYVIPNDTTSPKNYDYIETNYTIRFKVVEVKVFTSSNRELNIATGISTTLQITPNGSFSVFYNITYADGLKLVVSNNTTSLNPTLPAGTKITFIDFNPTESKATYYYYIVKANDNLSSGGISSFSISLEKFIKMGTTDQYFEAPLDSREVEYQFCIEFLKDNSDNSEISLTLTDNEASPYEKIIISKALVNKLENLDLTNQDALNNDNNEQIFELAIQANDTESEKVLVVNLDTTDYSGLNVSLYRYLTDGGLSEITVETSYGGYLFFKLASKTDVVNGNYKLIIKNNDVLNNNKDVKVSIDLRNTNATIPYVLENQTIDNHILVSNVTFTPYVVPEIYISVISDSNEEARIITSTDASLQFSILTNLDVINTNAFSVKLYSKVNDSYNYHSDLLFINNSINISNNLANGTYRIEFIYLNTVNYCNIIINR